MSDLVKYEGYIEFNDGSKENVLHYCKVNNFLKIGNSSGALLAKMENGNYLYISDYSEGFDELYYGPNTLSPTGDLYREIYCTELNESAKVIRARHDFKLYAVFEEVLKSMPCAFINADGPLDPFIWWDR